jgi:hypothetical protein
MNSELPVRWTPRTRLAAVVFVAAAAVVIAGIAFARFGTNDEESGRLFDSARGLRQAAEIKLESGDLTGAEFDSNHAKAAGKKPKARS